MKAGRELDALIAEKVMGHEGIKVFPVMHGAVEVGAIGRTGDREFVLPRYSTDIAAAWEVVEKFDNYELRKVQVGNDGSWIHYASLTDWKADTFGEATADTAAEAVCLAALAAVEVDS